MLEQKIAFLFFFYKIYNFILSSSTSKEQRIIFILCYEWVCGDLRSIYFAFCLSIWVISCTHTNA